MLYKGPKHLQALESAGDPGTNPHRYRRQSYSTWQFNVNNNFQAKMFPLFQLQTVVNTMAIPTHLGNLQINDNELVNQRLDVGVF